MVADAAGDETLLGVAGKIRQKRPVFIVANLLDADRVKRRLGVVVSVLQHVMEPVRLGMNLRACLLVQ